MAGQPDKMHPYEGGMIRVRLDIFQSAAEEFVRRVVPDAPDDKIIGAAAKIARAVRAVNGQ